MRTGLLNVPACAPHKNAPGDDHSPGALCAWRIYGCVSTRLFRASTTAAEVMVAPATASTSSPRVSGSALSMNCPMKSSSAHFWPKPAVSPLASTVSATITPSCSFTVTVTSLA